ncbi:hypothetical protein [Roseibacillus ishigakijimensis]|uniref:RRM domain-containing protein n=1 Tax=Roseibacillus ishigakijimensis TaxID=454146 RepID=A0A934RPL6_9BACT|nr:hypothetical protein [Roseibacillus ishigakijimensis]MBK1834655.1 hypothetical protein [Roseibacillus ishigakijimensis]
MSENNENRNNRNRGGGNRNRNRGPLNRNRQGGGANKGGASQKRDELQPRRSRRRKPEPLTFWQKILKFFGLFEDPNEKGRQEKKGQKSGRVPGGGPVKQGEGKGKPRRERKSTPPPTEVKSSRLYVGNLSYDATEYDLEELFKGIGAVRKVEIVYNRHTHKSKGYGFITMANVEEAERAVEVLHDQPYMGRKLIVNGARSKGPASNGGEGKPKRKRAPRKEEASPSPAEIPAEEEVHSLAPKED